MDSPSAGTCRKFVLWHGLLLTGKKGTIPVGGLEDGRPKVVEISWGTQQSESTEGFYRTSGKRAKEETGMRNGFSSRKIS